MYILTILKVKDLNRISSNAENLVRFFCFQVSLHYCIITLGGKNGNPVQISGKVPDLLRTKPTFFLSSRYIFFS